MLELRHAIEVNKEGTAHLDDGVVAGEQTNKIGKTLGDGDIAQLTGVGDTRQQHLVLIAAAQHLLHPAHHACGIVVLFHLAVERIAHYRAVSAARRS